MQRVLYLTPGCFDKGGISRYSRYQINALQHIFGLESVRVLSLLGPDEHALEEPFAVHWFGSARVKNSSRFNFAVRTLLNAAISYQPTIIFAAHVNFGPLVSQARKLCNARTFLNVYGLEIWSDLSSARRHHMRRFDQVIADCEFTANYVLDEGLRPARPSVIWDCVDLKRFQPGPADPAIAAKYGLPDPSQHFIMLSLGRLAKTAAHKGYDRLIQAVAELAPEHPRLHLAIAGRGDDQPRLEKLVAERDIEDRVTFTGAVDETDLPQVYRLAQVFSLVSDRGHGRGEGIPLTPLEAMACGAAVIVGDEDGSCEAVDGERNGVVVSPRDQAAQRAAIARYLLEPDRLAAAQREARAVAEERFGYHAFLSKHAALLGKGAAVPSKHTTWF